MNSISEKQFAKLALEFKYVTRIQLDMAYKHKQLNIKRGINLRLSTILIKMGVMTKEQVLKVLELQKPRKSIHQDEDHDTEWFKAVQLEDSLETDSQDGSKDFLDKHIPYSTIGAQAPNDYYIAILSPGKDIKCVVVGRKPLLIGRDKTCHVSFSDKRISRKQALIIQAGEDWVIIDRSGHGTTLVNSVPVLQKNLVPGDVIQIANHVLVFSAPTRHPKPIIPLKPFSQLVHKKTKQGTKQPDQNRRVSSTMNMNNTSNSSLDSDNSWKIIYLSTSGENVDSPETFPAKNDEMEFEIKTPLCLFGKDSNCHVIMPDTDNVNPFHAIGILKRTGMRLLPLGENSSLKDNKKNISRKILFDQEKFQLGDYRYKVSFNQDTWEKTRTFKNSTVMKSFNIMGISGEVRGYATTLARDSKSPATFGNRKSDNVYVPLHGENENAIGLLKPVVKGIKLVLQNKLIPISVNKTPIKKDTLIKPGDVIQVSYNMFLLLYNPEIQIWLAKK